MSRLERRQDELEKALKEHVEKSGHSGETDLRSRINRLEAAALGLVGSVATIAIRLLTGGHG